MVEHLPSNVWALGSLLSSTKNEEKKNFGAEIKQNINQNHSSEKNIRYTYYRKTKKILQYCVQVYTQQCIQTADETQSLLVLLIIGQNVQTKLCCFS